MTEAPPKQSREAKQSREERLAAQLRANLRRRKEQARELKRDDPAPPDPSQCDPSLPKRNSPR